jgi:RNA polymerase sigma factor (sigma-70 family)
LATLDEVRLPGFSMAPRGELGRLVRAAAEGDRQAWETLVARFERLVWAVARAHRLGGPDAADVVQTTWLRLVEHLDNVQDPERLGAWLATTARRECLRSLRSARREVPTDDGRLELVDDEELEVRISDARRDRALWAAFRKLPPRGQALLRLLASDPQPSYREISAALGMPIGSIGPTRARALEQLRAELGEIVEPPVGVLEPNVGGARAASALAAA